jgi:hypothetical protein
MRAILYHLALVSALLVVVSCRSTGKPAGAEFAAVDISGNTPGQVSQMAISVFEAHGYLVANPGPQKPVLEKQASGMSNLTWGNWISDTPVWERVRLTITPRMDNTCRLQCQAFLLRDRGSIMEEEIKVRGLHSGKYQELLEEVAKRLAGQPARPASPE